MPPAGCADGISARYHAAWPPLPFVDVPVRRRRRRSHRRTAARRRLASDDERDAPSRLTPSTVVCFVRPVAMTAGGALAATVTFVGAGAEVEDVLAARTPRRSSQAERLDVRYPSRRRTRTASPHWAATLIRPAGSSRRLRPLSRPRCRCRSAPTAGSAAPRRRALRAVGNAFRPVLLRDPAVVRADEAAAAPDRGAGRARRCGAGDANDATKSKHSQDTDRPACR